MTEKTLTTQKEFTGDMNRTSVLMLLLIPVATILTLVFPTTTLSTLTILVSGVAVLVLMDSSRQTQSLFSITSLGILAYLSVTGNEYAIFGIIFFVIAYMIASYSENRELYTAITISTAILASFSFSMSVIWFIVYVSASLFVEMLFPTGRIKEDMSAISRLKFLFVIIAIFFMAVSASYPEEIVILPGPDYYHVELGAVV